MLKWGRTVAVAFAIADAGLCAAVVSAQAAEPNTPSFLFFAGTDLWRYGAFFYGGTLWSPAGLDANGFTGIRQQTHLVLGVVGERISANPIRRGE